MLSDFEGAMRTCTLLTVRMGFQIRSSGTVAASQLPEYITASSKDCPAAFAVSQGIKSLSESC